MTAARFEMSEQDLQQRILDVAELYGWRRIHHRPAKTAKGWRTPMQGDPGFPDLVLARDGVVIVAELKSRRGQPTDDQKLWLEALGAHARLWRPVDWPAIEQELRRRR
ncbi:hypothetical protein ACFWMR_02170 [Amycolatopsis thailandensis]|uniref:hypothetical protein n=1 Tax=Amycolatopsis thailandensis TaxID=589330 RepID=UPI0036684D6D